MHFYDACCGWLLLLVFLGGCSGIGDNDIECSGGVCVMCWIGDGDSSGRCGMGVVCVYVVFSFICSFNDSVSFICVSVVVVVGVGGLGCMW